MAQPSERKPAPVLFNLQFDRRVWTLLITLAAAGAVGAPLTLYTSWQDNIRVGYAPAQPIAYSHTLHAGSMMIDCRYCHTGAETSARATVPSVDICMNCHTVFKGDEKEPEQVKKIAALRERWEKQEPIVWERVYDLSDFAYFHHGRHMLAGLDCRSCHGAVEAMAVVEKVSSMTMGWCLRCHMGRTEAVFTDKAIETRTGAQLVNDPIFGEILAPINCSTCHR